MDSTESRRDFLKKTVLASVPLAVDMGPAAGLAQDVGGPDREGQPSGGGSRQDPMSFFETVRTRRSVRRFLPTPVPEEDLMSVLDAARLAPTSGNQQPWKFLVVTEPDLIGAMEEQCVEGSLQYRRDRGVDVTPEVEASVREALSGYFSAPTYVVVLTDNESRYPTYNHWDGPLAAGNLMLAARALGYGTVFITDAIPDAVTKDVLGIPDRYTRVCITPVGVPEAWPDSPPKKALDEFVVRERF